MPYLEQIHFPVSPAGNEPTRYQILSMDLRNLALVPALAIRFGNDLRIGLSSGFLFSTGSLSFAEDLGNCTPSRRTARRIRPRPPATTSTRVRGSATPKFSVTLGGGIYWRHKNLEIGVSYQSHPLGGQVAGVEVAGDATTVTAPPGQPGGGLVTCAGGQSSRCVFGDIAYRLPDVVIAGATWHLRPGLELNVMARWLWTHEHDRIDIRLVGPDAGGRRAPPAHRSLPGVSRRGRYPGADRLLVARAAARRRRAAGGKRRRRQQRRQRRGRRRVSDRAGHPGRAATRP